ncbi:uncharacterized protein LOC104890919 isoform X2 [Beta vulgaris subsp. vulgaris]|uniref:uncharacterized protein LOC104890919 isoform X2 n=1 Tax=Beta vulgaris subsp. vulgaris TaxID=3555 RepID=UPI0025490B53|nr:uncharacterized protein LOC104890919 isoform X2 [Beta vulgaris subsp. vulgaris]
MAGICSSAVITSTTYYSKITNTTRCCSNPSTNRISKKQTPKLLKFAVNGVTEFLRIFSFVEWIWWNLKRKRSYWFMGLMIYWLYSSLIMKMLILLQGFLPLQSMLRTVFLKIQPLISVVIMGSTISGRDLYSRNLKLLVPFFEQPSIVLKSIEKGVDAGSDFVLANWSLRLSDMWKGGVFLQLMQLGRYSLLVLEDLWIEQVISGEISCSSNSYKFEYCEIPI